MTTTPLIALAMLAAAGCEPRAATLDEPAASASGAAAPEAAAKKKGGSDSYVLTQLAHEVPVGQPATVAFRVEPGRGLKINPEYPWKASVDAQASAGHVRFEGAEIARGQMKLEPSHASVPISLTVDSPGTHKVAASVSLSVCEKGNAARCLWFTDVPVDVSVTAK